MLWMAHKYTWVDASDGGCMRVHTLIAKHKDGMRRIADTNEKKANMFFETFFPKARVGGETIPIEPPIPNGCI